MEELIEQLKALQKKYDKLFDKVKRVRGWQKQYYKYYSLQDKQMMLINQKQLDNMIAIEESERKKKQMKIF